ncbi:MAG: hypothetical protein AB1631_14900 [Acidobacteriota bacterium]
MKITRSGALVAALSFFVCSAASAQWDKKPYTEWSQKETEKILNNSPWGQTQSLTDTSRMFDTGRRLDSGQSRVADVTQVNFRIRFLSARPVRQAISRLMEIQQKGELPQQLAAQLKAFAAADFPDYIVVTVTVDAPNPSNEFQAATAVLGKLTTAELKNDTWLLAKGGRKVFLKEYQSPRNDGLGARFIFPRIVDGKPFLTEESGDVQFYSELGGLFIVETREGNNVQKKPVFLNMRYKTGEMTFQGKMEY